MTQQHDQGAGGHLVPPALVPAAGQIAEWIRENPNELAKLARIHGGMDKLMALGTTAQRPSGEPLAKIKLVPVEVFGADSEDCPDCPAEVLTGYGLMDAVSAWSDCNRAIGHIYRVEDLDVTNPEREEGCITVYVPQSQVERFRERHGDGGARCPACHVLYSDLPGGHVLNRPTCSGGTP